MENEDMQYEVKPLLVLVSRGTRGWCGKFVQTIRHVGRRVVVTFLVGTVIALAAHWWDSRSRDSTKEVAGAATLATPMSHPATQATTSLTSPQTPSVDWAAPRVVTAATVPPTDSKNDESGRELSWRYFLKHLLRDLAIAFLVSAIVIFAFEWGSEVKHSLDLAGNLANVLTTHINTVVNASAADAIANAMRKLAGHHAEGFSRQLRSFAESIQKLGDGGWAGHGYLEFMEWYHNEITGYAESLALLSEKVSTDPKSKAEFRLLLPEATVPIDVMLARLTKAMTSCGTYYAISDVFTWTKLTNFQAAQKLNLANGLRIRRIFVVGKPSDVDVPAKEVSTRLRNHYDEAKKSGCGYRIRLTSQADFERLAAPILNKTEHFGIFKPADSEKHPIIVQVLEPQLLAFRIAGATEASAVLSAFKELWHDLPSIHCENEEDTAIDDHDCGADNDDDVQDSVLPAPSGGNPPAGSTSADKTTPTDIVDRLSGLDMIRDHLMAYRMRQLPRTRRAVVWYHGASDIELWTSGALKEFEQAVIEAAEDGIEIKRLFIFENPITFDAKDPGKTFRTLKKHMEISQRKPNYQWRVILRKTMPAELQAEPFALFRDGKNVEVEVARGSSDFGFGVPKAEATQLEEGFEEIWTQFRDPADRGAEPLTVIRAFDDVPWKELTPDLEHQLETYLNGVQSKLHGELEKSIETLFGEEANAVNQYMAPLLFSKKRASGNDQPDHHE